MVMGKKKTQLQIEIAYRVVRYLEQEHCWHSSSLHLNLLSCNYSLDNCPRTHRPRGFTATGQKSGLDCNIFKTNPCRT